MVLGGENGVAVGRAVRGFIENPQKASASRRALNVLLPECEDKRGRLVDRIRQLSIVLYTCVVLSNCQELHRGTQCTVGDSVH